MEFLTESNPSWRKLDLNEILRSIKLGDSIVLKNESTINDLIAEILLYFKEAEYIEPNALSMILLKEKDLVKETNLNVITNFIGSSKYAKEVTISFVCEDSQLFLAPFFITSDKLQIINYESLTNKIFPNFSVCDYSLAFDSNVASNIKKYHNNPNNNIQYKSLYELIKQKNYNIDFFPYMIEIIKNGLDKKGIFFRLNKSDLTQKDFFDNLVVLHQMGVFGKKIQKKFLNDVVKAGNKIIEKVYMGSLICQIFLVFLLQSKIIYKKEVRGKRKLYILKKMRELNIQIPNKFVAIINLFLENENHAFFNKIRNIQNTNDFIEKKLKNTASDILICCFSEQCYTPNTISFLLTYDKALNDFMNAIKPDLVMTVNGANNHIYTNFLKTEDNGIAFLRENPTKGKFPENKVLFDHFNTELERLFELYSVGSK